LESPPAWNADGPGRAWPARMAPATFSGVMDDGDGNAIPALQFAQESSRQATRVSAHDSGTPLHGDALPGWPRPCVAGYMTAEDMASPGGLLRRHAHTAQVEHLERA
jgi:hypothetical protein